MKTSRSAAKGKREREERSRSRNQQQPPQSRSRPWHLRQLEQWLGITRAPNSPQQMGSARVASCPRSRLCRRRMQLLLVLALFWAALYAYRAHRRRKNPATFLPAPSSSASSASPVLFSSRGTRITLHNFHLSLQLSSFNGIHLSWSARVKRTIWKPVFTLAYDVGTIIGALGMVASLFLLVWASSQLALSLYYQSYTHSPAPSSTLHKRDNIPAPVPQVPHSPHQVPLTLIVSVCDTVRSERCPYIFPLDSWHNDSLERPPASSYCTASHTNYPRTRPCRRRSPVCASLPAFSITLTYILAVSLCPSVQ